MKRIKTWLAGISRLAARNEPDDGSNQNEAIQKRFSEWASKPLLSRDGVNFVVIGEQKTLTSDFGLIESLRQRGYEVAFQDVPESR